MFAISGCYPGITGRVIDSETQMPIEGAIVLAQWTMTRGLPGLAYHTLYKSVETETDKDGKFSLSGVYSPFVDVPRLVICKKGYVTWRNDYIFPDYNKRTDYNIWQSGYEYRLDQFKSEYSIGKHSMFMDLGIMDIDFNRIPKFANAVRDESIRARPELDRQREEMYERSFIECLRSMTVGKYQFHEFCGGLSWQILAVGKQRLIGKTKDDNSNISKAMKDLGITVKTENDKTYFIKER